MCCRTERYINAWPLVLLLGSGAEMDMISLDQEMMVRHCYVNLSMLDAGAVKRMGDLEFAIPSENFGPKNFWSVDKGEAPRKSRPGFRQGLPAIIAGGLLHRPRTLRSR